MESLTFCSADPGVNNSALVFVNITKDWEITVDADFEFDLKSEEDNHLNPGEIYKKEKTNYANYLAKSLNSLNLVEEIETHCKKYKDAIFVFEKNDNKYTRFVAPILTGMLSKEGRAIHLVNPVSVWNSLKRLAGWQKGEKPNRDQKKKMTRRFLSRHLLEAETNSDDTNDAIFNAVYMAKRMGLFKKKKKIN